MSLFQFEWVRCRDGYRIEERRKRPHKDLTLDDPGGFVIVPKSNNWDSYKPLNTPAPYRAFAKWDALSKKHGPEEALRRLADAYGPMSKREAKEESVAEVLRYVLGLRQIVASIDRADWRGLARWLQSAGQSKTGPRPGVGRLGAVFQVVDDGKPEWKLQPPTLVDALQAQALFDAVHGIKHKRCANPECEQWFPTSGPDAFRVDAEYHSEKCRRRHAYLQSRKERRA